jgi:hypothetical protein
MTAKEMSAKTPTGSASKKEAAPVPAKEKTATVKAEVPAKKTSPWMIASLGGIVLLCILFFVLASNRQRIFRANRQPTETVTSVAPTLPLATDTVVAGSTLTSEPPTPTLLPTSDVPTPSPAVLEAQQRVQQNPSDPNANLDLALAYWDNDQPFLAFQTLNTAASLATPTDRPFFLNAAQKFAEREAWVASAAMYLRAIKTLPPNSLTPPELETAMHEAVYKAASSRDMPQFLPFDSIARVDQPIALIAEGRFNLFSGDTVKAREFLNRARGLNPNMGELNLLDAEITFREGQREKARAILAGLSSDLSIPDWIRKQADEYLVQFQ